MFAYLTAAVFICRCSLIFLDSTLFVTRMRWQCARYRINWLVMCVFLLDRDIMYNKLSVNMRPLPRLLAHALCFFFGATLFADALSYALSFLGARNYMQPVCGGSAPVASLIGLCSFMLFLGRRILSNTFVVNVQLLTHVFAHLFNLSSARQCLQMLVHVFGRGPVWKTLAVTMRPFPH